MTVKNPKHITFTALALVIIAAVSIGATAFSQGSYPPPTGLTATTQSVGSGKIKLAWVKPSSSEVIGYNIYRNGVYLDYTIGADSLSYYDTDLSPSQLFTYFVKAVYLGVPEEDLPASNTVSAVSPAYCTISPCVGISPFVDGPGFTIVDLGGFKLSSSMRKSGFLNVSLPTGRYQVYTHSFDAYAKRATRADSINQKNERWFVSLLSGGKEIYTTNLTADLRDGVNEAEATNVVDTEFVLAKPIDQIQIKHAGYVNGGPWDSVGLSAVKFVNMDTADSDCLLVINKTADKTEVAPGDLITYTITVRNDGDANCTGWGTYIYDVLPWQVTYVGETQSGGIGTNGYYSDGHYVWLVAYTPLVPGEVGIATITVRVNGDIPVASCEGDDDPGPDGGPGDDIITNQVYATNNEYGARSMNVYSNSAATLCDSDPVIDTTVVPSPNPSYPGGEVTWTATPFGECPGPFSYSWTGDDGLTGNSASVSHTYDDPGSYYATVTITAPNCQTLVKESPMPVVIEFFVPSSVSCVATPRIVEVGRSVNWRAAVEPSTPPGGGSYSFTWSGDDGLSGTGPSITKTYDSIGVKNATVLVGGGVQELASCSVTVKERARPRYEEI